MKLNMLATLHRLSFVSIQKKTELFLVLLFSLKNSNEELCNRRQK